MRAGLEESTLALLTYMCKLDEDLTIYFSNMFMPREQRQYNDNEIRLTPRPEARVKGFHVTHVTGHLSTHIGRLCPHHCLRVVIWCIVIAHVPLPYIYFIHIWLPTSMYNASLHISWPMPWSIVMQYVYALDNCFLAVLLWWWVVYCWGQAAFITMITCDGQAVW